jgi:SAM-dependent methyltransferase
VRSKKDPDLERFLSSLYGFAAFETIVAASRLDLFTVLARNPGSTAADLEAALGVGRYPLRVLLLACCAFGLLEKGADGTYRNRPYAERTLCRENPFNFLPLVEFFQEIVYPGLALLEPSVRAGRNEGLKVFPGRGNTLYERLADRPRLQEVFHDAMSCISRNANQVLIDAPELGRCAHVVDVGGGDGTNAIALCRRNPGLRMTVFDLPEVCRAARENIEKAGLADRVATVPGDFFRDPLPAEGEPDGYLFCHVFNIYSPEKDRKLIAQCHERLPPGGAVFAFNSVCDDRETGPIPPAAISLYFLALASGEGMVYPLAEYERWFADAGFARVKTRRFGPDHVLVMGVKGGRKRGKARGRSQAPPAPAPPSSVTEE